MWFKIKTVSSAVFFQYAVFERINRWARSTRRRLTWCDGINRGTLERQLRCISGIFSNTRGTKIEGEGKAPKMVTLVVATTADPASIGPASSLLAMPGWNTGPSVQDIPSFVNGNIRLLKHDNSIVKEDYLDKRWEDATGEVVDEVIFLSRHTAVSNRPALTVHPIGVPHIADGETPPAGGKPGWAGPPSPRIGPWLRLLKKIAGAHNLIPEFEITLEATHHGPLVDTPTMFVEIGSTEEYWKRQDAAQAVALVG